MAEQSIDRYAVLASDNTTVAEIVMGNDELCASWFPGVTCVRAPYSQFFVTIGSTWDAVTKTFTPPAAS